MCISVFDKLVDMAERLNSLRVWYRIRFYKNKIILLVTDKERTWNGQGTDIYVDKVNFSIYDYNIGDNIYMNTEKLLELKSKGEGYY